MRESLAAAGYEFVALDEMSVAEKMAPELRLLEVLRQKRMPYTPLGVGVQQFLASSPSVRFDDVGLTRICRGNNTPHEGAHAAIFEAAVAKFGPLEGRRVVEALIAGEGFAMAFEFWLTLLLMNLEERTTPIFFALNAAQDPYSLASLEHDAPGILARLGELAVAMPAAVMKLLAATGLIANVRPNARAFRDELFSFLLAYAGLEGAKTDDAKMLVRVALGLDDNFRNVTARTFFRFCELEPEYDALCALPLEHHFGAGAVFNECLPVAIDMVVGSGHSS
jgi:hypothetical protein